MNVGTDFSGVGAPEMALTRMGFDHTNVFACEIDKYARKSYHAIHGNVKMYEDITKRDHSEVPQLDLYVAGFPCQAFSMAGKRGGFDDVRGTLFFDTADFIRINQPKCFVLENVKGLLSHDSGKTFQTIMSLLSDNGGTINGQYNIPYYSDGLGYHCYWQVLNTKNYGIPQNRERVFIVGFKEPRSFSFPLPFKLELRLKDMLQDNPEGKYYLSDKMINNIMTPSDGDWQSGKMEFNRDIATTINSRVHKMGRADTDNYIKVDDKYYLSDKNLQGLMKGQQSPQITEGDDIARCFTAGGNSGGMHSGMTLLKVDDKYYLSDDIINTLNKHKARNDEQGNGFGWNPTEGYGVAVGLKTSSGFRANDNFIKSHRIRRLTPLECWRLQFFSDADFFKAQAVNSDTQLYKQAGNSMSVNVLIKLFEKIFE